MSFQNYILDNNRATTQRLERKFGEIILYYEIAFFVGEGFKQVPFVAAQRGKYNIE